MHSPAIKKLIEEIKVIKTENESMKNCSYSEFEELAEKEQDEVFGDDWREYSDTEDADIEDMIKVVAGNHHMDKGGLDVRQNIEGMLLKDKWKRGSDYDIRDEWVVLEDDEAYYIEAVVLFNDDNDLEAVLGIFNNGRVIEIPVEGYEDKGEFIYLKPL